MDTAVDVHELRKVFRAKEKAPGLRGSVERRGAFSRARQHVLRLASDLSCVFRLRDGPVAEALVRTLVTQVRQCHKAEGDLRQLLTAAFADLPGAYVRPRKLLRTNPLRRPACP